MFASPVLTNIKGFSYITVIVSHQWEKSNLVQSHAILNHMWLGQFYDILIYFAYLETSRGFTIQCLSSKTSASPLFLSTSCFQAGKLSVERPQTARKYMWFNESTQKLESYIWMLSEITSRRIVLIVFPGRSTTCRACRSWFSICPKSHPESLAPLVCISGIWSTPWPQKNWIQTKLPPSCVGAIGLDRS